MKGSTTTLLPLLAATAMGAPVMSTTAAFDLPSDVFDQGDGFYSATLNESGKIHVTFTKKEVLLARNDSAGASTFVSEIGTAHDARALSKRDGVECVDGVSKSLTDLDWANVQLAKNADGHYYDPNHWGWVHNKKETSYFCPYRAWHGSYDTVMAYHTTLSKGCENEASYGYNHHAARNEADVNLSIGRTYRGNPFCDKHFRPPPTDKPVEQVHTPAVVNPRRWILPQEMKDQGTHGQDLTETSPPTTTIPWPRSPTGLVPCKDEEEGLEVEKN
ncbi:hypothetical protein ACEQ8H_001903 [Pleosporales sp. CAS-2024a]